MTLDGSRARSTAGLAIVLTIFLGVAAWVVLNSAVFDIREVRVEGAHQVPAADVRRVAAIAEGENLLKLETTGIEQRLGQNPWIRDASVEKDLPSTVIIEIIERRSVGSVEGANGWAVLASDGTVLEVAGSQPGGVPTLGEVDANPVVGSRLAMPEPLLELASSMSPPLRRSVAAVELQGTELVIDLRDGGEVLYGEAEDLAAKNRALSGMLRWARGEGVAPARIDVRVPGAPSLEPARHAR